MKKILVFTIISAAVLLGNRSSAQYLLSGSKADSTLPQIEFGIKLGANVQSISGPEMWEQSYNPGIAGGIFVGMHKNKIGVRLEILASTSRYNARTLADSLGNKGDFRATYLNLPVLFEYCIIPKLLLQVGPQYSNMLSIKSVTAFSGDVKALFNQSEFAGVIGFEGKLPKHISAGARYIYGFSDLNNQGITNEKWSTSTIQVYAAYAIK